MRNLLMFSTVLTVIITSLCVGVPRYNNAVSATIATDSAKVADLTPPIELRDQATQDVSSTQISTPPPSPQVFTAEQQNIPNTGKVLVLNGCGIKDAAVKMEEFLRSKNFDVKYRDNASSWNYPATMIISHIADMSVAYDMEKYLKTGKVILIRNSGEYEQTVVIGHDYDEDKFKKNR